jgi:hypothetical protein
MRFVRRDIRDVWAKIKEPLSKTIHPDNLIEEIYHECRSNTLFIFTVEEGFIVVKETLLDTGDKDLWVFIAYGEGVNLFEKYEADLDELAKMSGCNRISFSTQRKGWERLLSDKWVVNSIEYTKRLT